MRRRTFTLFGVVSELTPAGLAAPVVGVQIRAPSCDAVISNCQRLFSPLDGE